ncbi:MAG TPA: PIG-L deacetylase family protein [Acidimicrobiia bacterium]|nr:PIG-L deacetylase family protein [Acidimicrobiia bacterium]
MNSESVLVISAHVGDFVWRAGGAIALYAARGHGVTVVCLSYGERGESARLWREGLTLEQVKEARHAEAVAATNALGADLITFDADDYPLVETPELLDRLVGLYREVRPTVVLTHTERDPWNRDHEVAHSAATKARILAQAAGYDPGREVIAAPPVFLFEPHQTEYSGFMPDVLLDITEVWNRKLEAMYCMEGQQHLWDYYTDVAVRRGVQARRNSGPNLGLVADTKAEAYQRVYPQVAGELA